jgi:signal peptidase I
VKIDDAGGATPQAAPQPQPHAQHKPAKSDRVRREVLSLLWLLLAFTVIEGGVAQARVISSGSMEKTVLIGDHLLVSRLGFDAGIPFTTYHVPLWRSPERGQIIVFHAPLEDQSYPDLIKRCIGVPGDRIRIVAGDVFVNGERITDPHAIHRPGAASSPWENFPAQVSQMYFADVPSWRVELAKDVVNGELVVPAGKYFMMGDNRDDSNDSRFWGFVPRENIVGTPVIVYMSIKGPGDVWEPGHAVERFKTYLNALIHPGEVRWNHLLQTFPVDTYPTGGRS